MATEEKLKEIAEKMRQGIWGEEYKQLQKDIEENWNKEECHSTRRGYKECFYCRRSDNYSRFHYTRKSAERTVPNGDEPIRVRDVIDSYTCPKCKYTMSSMMTVTCDEDKGFDAERKELVVFCEDCKKSFKLEECKMENYIIQDSEMYYYGNYKYDCPVCSRLLMKFSF